jgi:hypothetical protein
MTAHDELRKMIRDARAALKAEGVEDPSRAMVARRVIGYSVAPDLEDVRTAYAALVNEYTNGSKDGVSGLDSHVIAMRTLRARGRL